MNDTIDLWTERGVPFAHTLNHIHERHDQDCVTAYRWFRKWGVLTDDVVLKICDIALSERSTRKIFAKLNATIEPTLRDLPWPKEFPIEYFHELHALVIENFVRIADRKVPIPGNN